MIDHGTPMQWAGAFFALLWSDIFWGVYVRRVGQGHALSAAVNAVLLFLSGAVAVISYTTNPWLLVPAAAGAFAGTWLAVWMDKKGLA